MARRVRTTALRWVKPPMATSMRPRTGTPTKHREWLERFKLKYTEIQHVHLLWPKRGEKQFSFKGGEDRKKAADRRPLIPEAEVGNRDRQVLEAHLAGAVAVVGEVAGEPNGGTQEDTEALKCLECVRTGESSTGQSSGPAAESLLRLG